MLMLPASASVTEILPNGAKALGDGDSSGDAAEGPVAL
jgi:hypothetical protein